MGICKFDFSVSALQEAKIVRGNLVGFYLVEFVHETMYFLILFKSLARLNIVKNWKININKEVCKAILESGKICSGKVNPIKDENARFA